MELDFFRLFDLGICLKINTLSLLSLDLAVAVYPLLLMLITYSLIHMYDLNYGPLVALWKPFKRISALYKKNWDLKTSMIDSFATFMFLSNAKFLSVIFDLLVPVTVNFCAISNETDNSNVSLRLAADANITYFGREHIPYVIIALLSCIMFVILPLVLLILFPFSFCQKSLDHLPIRWQILFQTFVDSFQGCYKDGTGPYSHDYRWFSAVSFMTRFNVIFIFGIAISPVVYSFQAIALTVTAIIFIAFNPYKNEYVHYTSHFTFFLLCLASIYTLQHGIQFQVTNNIGFPFQSLIVLRTLFLVVPLVYISIITITWIFNKRKVTLDSRSKIKPNKLAQLYLGNQLKT